MDICLELKPKQGELRPQKNNPGQHITRENVAEYDPDESTLLNIRMETAQYGLYEAQPAILIVLRFIVKFRGGNRRIRSFNVNVEFSNHSDVEQIPSPSVKAFAPDDCDGTLFGLEDNPDTSLVEQRRFLPTIEGWKKSSKDGPDNIVVWDCVETERRIAGLPAGYRGVIVIQHAKDAKLQATFKVHVDCGRFNVARRIYDWSKLFSAARRDDPVIFLPGQAFGRQYPALQDFKHLDLSTLSRLGQRSVRPSSTTKNSTVTRRTTRSKVLRATRVPPSFTALDLQELLSPASPDAIVVHSLQLDAGSDDSQVATISSNVSGSGNPGSNIDLGAKGGFGPVVLDSFFLGITVLASPSKNANISMDIIAVPGLNGHAFGSWKERNGEFMWLRDGLPETLQRSRIMIYGYDAKLDGSSSYATISNYGKSLLHDVVLARKDSPGRLLVFLAHSLGGLLVKEAIVYASRDESNGNEVLKALHGLVFIGVPHRGLKVEHLMAMVENQPNQKLVEALEPESFHLQTLHESFVHAIKSARPKVYSWFETAESNTVIKVGNSWKTEGPPARLVSQSSATHATSYEEPGDQYPMNLSHSEMIKFSISQVYYKQLRAQLEDLENSIAT